MLRQHGLAEKTWFYGAGMLVVRIAILGGNSPPLVFGRFDVSDTQHG